MRVPANSFVPKLCFLLTGASALISEVCWIRKSSLTLGSSTWAMSVVLAVFFAGLAIGSYFVGKWSHRVRSPLRGYAFLEFGVGCATLASPWLFVVADSLFEQWYPAVFQSKWQLTCTRVAIAAAVMLPATTLMGGSLPLFCQQFVRDRARVAQGIGVLYGINTFGAALGAAACGLWLIPNIGVNASLYLAGAINIAVGFVAFVLALRQSTASETAPAAVTDATASPAIEPGELAGRQRLLAAWLFFGVGFVAVAAEVLWTRYLSVWVPNTVYTYTITLTVILLGIVLGSILSSVLSDRIRMRGGLFGLAQVGGSLAIMLVMQLRPAWWGAWFNAISPTQQIVVISLVMLVPSVLSGLTFPLAIRLVATDLRRMGLQTGRMTALNLVGGICGSLLIGFVTLPLLGLQGSLFLVTGIGLGLGILAWMGLESRVSWAIRSVWCLAAIVVWTAIPAICRTRLPQDFLSAEGTLVDFREGVNANVAVVRKGESLHLQINRMWQGQNLRNHQVFAAHIPALIHPDPKKVLVIGLGTGQTAGSFLYHPIERLDCLEIEDGLIDLVREHFMAEWMDDSRVRMIVEDGHNYVTHTPEQYDIVSIEVGQFYRPRISSFYTYEFYSKLRSRLTSGGLACQFLPIEFFRPEELRTLVATFQQVFPQCALWYNTSEFLLIGCAGDRLPFNLTRFSSAVGRNAILKEQLDYAYWGGAQYFLSRPEAFIAGFLCGPTELARLGKGADIYHDDRPYLEYVPLRNESDVASNLALVQRHLTPFSELIGHIDASRLTAANKIRTENLKFIFARIALARAESFWFAGDPEAAAAAYDEALAALPDYPKANARLAMFMRSHGEIAGAIKFYERALEADPTKGELRLELSEMLMTSGQLAAAEKSLRELLYVDPDHARANSMLGAVLQAKGDLEEAEKYLRKSVLTNPAQTDVLISLASILLLRNRDDLARNEFEKARLSAHDSSNVHAQIGWAYGQAGRNAEAMKHFELALARQPRAFQALLGMANVLQAMGQPRQAQQKYEQLLAGDPQLVEARVGLALLLQSEKRRDEAIQNYRRALERAPHNVTVLTNIAWLLATHPDATHRDPQQALVYSEQAWHLSNQQSPYAADALAAAYASLDQFDRALEYSSLALELSQKLNLPDLCTQIQNRRSLYQQKQIYTE